PTVTVGDMIMLPPQGPADTEAGVRRRVAAAILGLAAGGVGVGVAGPQILPLVARPGGSHVLPGLDRDRLADHGVLAGVPPLGIVGEQAMVGAHRVGQPLAVRPVVPEVVVLAAPAA